MAPNDPSDPKQPSLLDLIRTMAWAPANLPQFSGPPPASTNMPADGPSGGLAASGPGGTPPTPWTNFLPPASYAPPSRGADFAAAPAPRLAAVNADTAQASGASSNAQPSKVPLPYRRPWNAPQAPPIGMSQATPWSPNVSGFTPADAPPAFDARWANSAPSPSLLDMSNVPSLLSQQTPKPSADGRVDPRYVYDYFLNRGFNTAQAAALVGNMMRESDNLKPDAVNPAENAHGFLSWEGPRWPALQKFAAARGTSPTM